MRENESKADERSNEKKVGRKRWRELREWKGDELLAGVKREDERGELK